MRFSVLFMLSSLIDKKERRIVGLMSGTSADGIDAAIIELIQKEEEAVSVSLLAFDTISFPDGLRDRILEISDPEHGNENLPLHLDFWNRFKSMSLARTARTRS